MRRASLWLLLLAGWLSLSVLACSSAPTCCDVTATVSCAGCCGNTTSLSLTNSNISSLPADVFARLSSLQMLDLSRNNLATLPSGLFSNNGALEHINLYANQLSELPTDIFSSLGNVQFINLGTNQLSDLPTNIFSSLGNVQSINLGQNLLREITAHLFEGTPRLDVLSLCFNPLQTVPADLFRHIGNISSLCISTEGSTLPDNFFSPLWNLTVLALGDGGLEYLAPDLVWSNTNLQAFELFNNPVSSLPAGLLDYASALTVAWIVGNNLSALPGGFFDNNGQLKSIELSENPFTPSGLPSDLFSKLSNLAEFFLRNTTLSSLPFGLLSPTRNAALNEISLENNALMPAICRTTFDSLAAIPAQCIAKPPRA
jgi:Leucine-rich repeat (LRR) protein